MDERDEMARVPAANLEKAGGSVALEPFGGSQPVAGGRDARKAGHLVVEQEILRRARERFAADCEILARELGDRLDRIATLELDEQMGAVGTDGLDDEGDGSRLAGVEHPEARSRPDSFREIAHRLHRDLPTQRVGSLQRADAKVGLTP